MAPMIFDPVRLGDLDLANRIVMAPMTRGRAGPGDVPGDLIVEYYRQRASAGLIVTEGVQPSAEGKGYWRTPGVWSQDQKKGWARVAGAVHERGGRIAMQLMHCGRVVVAANRGYEAEVIAPSAVTCPDPVPGPDGVPVTTTPPRAMEFRDMKRVVGDYATAASLALEAGLDGVELHCASGYLINQFLNAASNRRTDAYGGSVENRIRFPLEVLEALSKAIGPGRVGFRVSPGNPYNGMDVAHPAEVFGPFIKAASDLNLAYCHVIDMGLCDLDALDLVRSNGRLPIIANNNLKLESAQNLLGQERAEAVSFGRAFIANPDLVERFRQGAPLARPDFAHLYVGEERGFTDYLPL